LSSLAALFVALLLLVARPVAAAPAPDSSDPAPLAEVTPRPVPESYHMGQMKYSVQTLNNCGPASVVAVLSYYGFDISQGEARKVLRPYSDSRGMSHNVIPPYMAKFGLQSKVRLNGNDDIIKALVANDIPVIVLQYVSETWRIGHFRVVQGYDDTQGVFYADDSLYGPDIAISYKSFDARWDYQWSRYVPVYRPDQAPLVAAILGTDWTDKGMYERALPEVRAEIEAKPTNWSAWSRLVEALTGAEKYQEALDTYDTYTAKRGNAPNSPGQFGGPPNNTNSMRLKLLSKLGRFQELLDTIETAQAKGNNNGNNNGNGGFNNGNGSMWLYKGDALRGLGRFDEARAAYERAVTSDGIMSEAGERLKTLPE